MRSPTVSLVMCTVGGRSTINRLVSSLESQTSTDFELIVVDQGPESSLERVLGVTPKSFPARYLRSEPGLSRARNVGLAACRGEILAFPDDDCWYPPGVIQQVIDLFSSQPDVAINTGRTIDADMQDSNGRFLRRSAAVNRRNVWYAGNSNAIFVRREVIASIGPFDETLGAGSGSPFGAGEETDLLLRAIDRGVRVEFIHELAVHHDQVNILPSAATFEKAKLYSRGFGRTLRLNRYPVGYALYRAGRSGIAAALALCSRNADKLKLKRIWVTGTLEGYFSPVPVERPRAGVRRSSSSKFRERDAV